MEGLGAYRLADEFGNGHCALYALALAYGDCDLAVIAHEAEDNLAGACVRGVGLDLYGHILLGAATLAARRADADPILGFDRPVVGSGQADAEALARREGFDGELVNRDECRSRVRFALAAGKHQHYG